MKNLMFILVSLLFVTVANAGQFNRATWDGINPDTVAGGLAAGFVLVMLSDEGQACDDEPLRTVAYKDNPNGYRFEVAGCDYQAKKNQFVLKTP